MKFKVGFLLGAAAGAYVASKAAELRGGVVTRSGGPGAASAEEATEKLRAISGLARERLSGVVDSPLGAIARDRIAEVLSASLGAGSSARRPSSKVYVATERDPAAASSWPR